MAFWKKNIKRRTQKIQNVMFTLKDIENGKLLYQNWINIYNMKKSAISIFFALRYRRETFIDELFLDLMHILEDYHRHSIDFQQTIEPDHKFNEKITDILDYCPDQYKNWLKKILKYSNEINLEWRINTILKHFSFTMLRLFPNKKIQNKTVQKMVASRNYLTHRSERAKEMAIEDFHNFFYFNDLIRIIITMLLLKDFGMTKEEIYDKIYCVPEFINILNINWKQIN